MRKICLIGLGIFIFCGLSFLLYPEGKKLYLSLSSSGSVSGWEQFAQNADTTDFGIVQGAVADKNNSAGIASLPESGEEETQEQKNVDAVAVDMYFVYEATTIVLPSEVVKRFVRGDCTASESDCLSVIPCVNVGEIQSYVEERLQSMLGGSQTMLEAKNENGAYFYRDVDWSVDTGELVNQIVNSLAERAQEYRNRSCRPETEYEALYGANDRNPVIWVRKMETAGTDGLYAPFYIEIDDSQQHLYLWQDGVVIRDYEVSGFYDEYAVYGVFSIGEKSSNAWSSIAKKWMPWWMAYYYDKRQDAWLGIHELVYWTDENGVYHEESSESIGQKKSGGCVRLDRGKAQELYDLVPSGTPLLIHP